MKYLQRTANKRLGLMTGSAILGLACGAFVSAAEATWDPVVTSNSTIGEKFDSTGVNNEGDTVLAWMVNSGGPVTVNGVTVYNRNNWTQNGVTLNYSRVGAGTTYQNVTHFVTTSPNDHFSGPTVAERDAYIHMLAGMDDAQGDITLTLSGLTVGQEYLAQIWVVDMRNAGNKTQTIALDGGTPSDPLLWATAGRSSYVIGRFTADATSASFVLNSSTNDRAVNAFQLRAILPGDPPTADFSATPTQGIAPLEVTFTDNSTAGSGAIVTRHWDFGDGNSTTTENTSIAHTFAAPGTYDVTLTITADDEHSDSFSQTISVVSAEPTAVFSASPTSGFAPLEVTFTDSSDPGASAIINRHWDLGDGNSTTTGATTLTHTYATPGTYIVTLTVTNDDGFSDSTTETINVAEAGSITWEPVVTSGGGTKFDSTGVNNEGSTVLAMMVNSGSPTS
jgi:PKD repeat protein